MTAKAWLNRGRDASRNLSRLEADKRAAEHRATRITTNMRERVNTGSKGRNDEILVAMADYSLEFDMQIAEFYRLLSEISRAIFSIDDGKLRVLLIKRYILFKTWETVAEDMNYSYENVVQRLHVKALNAIELIIGDLTNGKN